LSDAATKLRHLTFSSSSFSYTHEVSMSKDMGSQAVNSGSIPGLQEIITTEVLEHACNM
jgi:hypothetical protein